MRNISSICSMFLFKLKRESSRVVAENIFSLKSSVSLGHVVSEVAHSSGITAFIVVP
jgi:hypothetical protein